MYRQHVCLSVCRSVFSLFVREHISGTARPMFTDFCMLCTAVAQSFIGGVAIYYGLPVYG